VSAYPGCPEDVVVAVVLSIDRPTQQPSSIETSNCSKVRLSFPQNIINRLLSLVCSKNARMQWRGKWDHKHTVWPVNTSPTAGDRQTSKV